MATAASAQPEERAARREAQRQELAELAAVMRASDAARQRLKAAEEGATVADLDALRGEIADLEATMRSLTENLAGRLDEMARDFDSSRQPTSWQFVVERDRFGLLTSVVASPLPAPAH